MNFTEHALQFRCDDASLYGILSLPARPSPRGVLIVVGGPQYRVGSHRQFVLLARQLAEAGVAVIRFDYRGMGDSEGCTRSFEQVNEDIRAALDQFAMEVPAVKEIVIFGLCDAACAALFYAHEDPRIHGLILVNPWARTSEGLAKTYLKHYYLSRLFTAELWRKIFRRQFEYKAAIRSFFHMLATIAWKRARRPLVTINTADATAGEEQPLPERMLLGLHRFRGHVLFILSGNDFTAQEFLDLVKGSGRWKKLLASPSIQCRMLQTANHTFSRRDWRDQLAQWIKEWIG